MDISKIRKKAKEKQHKSEEAPVQPAAASAKEEESPAPVIPESQPESEPSDSGVKTDDNAAPEQGSAAAEPDESGGNGLSEIEQMLELLTFRLGDEEFAFKVSEVEEIIRYQSITKVPTLPDYVQGITSLRGKIIPVIELRKRLVLRTTAPKQDGEHEDDVAARAAKEKILIISGPKGFIGACIDKVLGVVRFPHGNVLDPPAHLSEEEMRYIEGVVILDKRFISIIRTEDALDIEIK